MSNHQREIYMEGGFMARLIVLTGKTSSCSGRSPKVNPSVNYSYSTLHTEYSVGSGSVKVSCNACDTSASANQ